MKKRKKKKLFKKNRPRTIRRKRRRMTLESLEDRRVLTAVGLLPDGTLQIQDLDSAANDLTIRVDAASGSIFVSDAGVAALDIDTRSGVLRDPFNRQTAIVPAALLTGFAIDLGGADDRLTVDFFGGDPVQGRPFDYEGGDQATRFGDSLRLVGGSYGTVEHRLENANDGSIVLDEGTTITYTGLEPIDDDLNADIRIFSFLAASDETIVLSDDADLGDDESFIDSTEGESVEFINPVDELIIRTGAFGGAGSDVVNVQGLDSLFSADFIVVAEGDDALNFDTNDTSTNGGDITGTAGAIQVVGVEVSTVNAPMPSGNIDLTAIDITMTPGAELRANGAVADPGDISLLATFVANAEADDVDPFDILALSTPTVILETSRVDGDNVNIAADATADVSFAADVSINDSVSLAGLFATSNASIVINQSTLVSERQLNIRSEANTAADLTRVPEDDDDANDDDKQEDAAIATSLATSNANVSLTNSIANAGTVLNIIADNVVNATTLVDGLAGDSDAGGVVTTNVVTGATSVDVADSTLTALGVVTISSTSQRTQTTTAVATTDGATEDGNNATMTEGQETLSANNASTSDGDMTLAAAIAIATMSGDTIATVTGSDITSSVADIQIISSATHSVATTSDGSSTSGGSDTGVGVAFALSTITADSLTNIDQANSFHANNVNISSAVAGDIDTDAMSGLAGDANGADVTVAGSLAIAVDKSDAETTLGTAANVNANGANVSLAATQVTSSEVTAVPVEDVMGESTGVGASVATNITDHTTSAEIVDGASLTNVGDLTVASNSSNDVDTSATSAAAGGTGVAAVVALTINNEDTTARIGSGGNINASGDVNVSTIHFGDATTIAEGDAEGEDSAAVGVAIGLDFTDANVSATTSRNIAAGGNVAVASASDTTSIIDGTASAAGTSGDGDGDPDTNTQAGNQRDFGDQIAADHGARDTSDSQSNPSASSSEGDVSVAAAVAVNVVESMAGAAIEAGDIIAGGAVLVSSQKSSNAQANADGSATGGESAGVGAAVAINANDTTNQATIAGTASVDATSLSVFTGMTPGSPQHISQATSMAGAGDTEVGVAGSVSINLVDIRTDATIASGASVDLSGGDLTVQNASALRNLSAAAPVQEGGQGSDVGIGASFAMNRITNDARAEVENSAVVSGNVLNAQVLNEIDLTTTTDSENGAAGDTGVGAAVGLTIVNNESLARLGTGSGLDANGNVEVRSDHAHANSITAGAEVAGDSTGVGATVAIIDANETNDAIIARNVTAGGTLDLRATVTVSSTIDATASAGGSDSSDDDADTEADSQRNHHPDSGPDSALPSAADSSSNANSQSMSDSSTGSSGVGVAAVVGVNVVRVTNDALVQSGADVDANGEVAIEALAHTDAIAMATGTAVSLNDSNNIGAAVSVNRPNVTNRAIVSSNSIVEGDGILLRAETPGQEVNDFVSWAAAAGGGTGDLGIAGSVGVNVIDMRTDARAAAGSHLRSLADLDVESRVEFNLQTLAAGGGFSQGTSVGAAVAVTTLDVDTIANVLGDADASDRMGLRATSMMDPTQMDLPLLNNSQDPMMTTLAVAGGLSSGDVGVAGAVVVNIFDLNTRAAVGSNSNINQDGGIPDSAVQALDVIAIDNTETISMTGALGIAFGSAGVAAGLDLGVINKQTRATIGNGAVVTARGAVGVHATSTEKMTTLSTNVGVGDSAGVAGSASVYVVDTETQALVADNATVDTNGAVEVTANGDYSIVSVAGVFAFGSSAGVGAANVTLTHTDSVLAEIGDSTSISAGDDIVVDARSSEDLIGTSAAGAGASTAAVAASATVVVMNETTRAGIGRNANITADNGAAAGMPNVVVNADDFTNIVTVSGSLAASGSVGVGAGADVATINKDTRALIDSNTTADVEGDIVTTADSLEDITSVAAGVAIGANVGVAIDAAVHVLDVTTMAYIGDDPSDGTPSAGPGDIHAGGTIVIAADEWTEMDNVVGAAAGGVYTGAATAAGIAVVDKQTQAFVGAGQMIRADGNTAGREVRTGQFDITYENESLGTPGVEAQGGISIDSDSGTLSGQGEVGLAEVDDVDIDEDGGNDATDESLSGQRVATPQTVKTFMALLLRLRIATTSKHIRLLWALAPPVSPWAPALM